MDRNEKIGFIESVLVNEAEWSKNLERLILHKVRRCIPDAHEIGITDDTFGNFYVVIETKEKEYLSIYDIEDSQIIEELYDLCLFIKED